MSIRELNKYLESQGEGIRAKIKYDFERRINSFKVLKAIFNKNFLVTTKLQAKFK